MKTTRLSVAAGAFALLCTSTLTGQQGAVEFGVDAGVELTIVSDADNLTTVGIPIQNLRVGFFVSDAVSLEPSVSLNILSGGGETLTTFSGGASLLYHFTSDPARSRVYLRGGGHFALIDLSGGSVNQLGVSGGIGIKAPAGPLAIRVEGLTGYSFENDDLLSSLDLGLLFGISFFTN